MRWLPGIFLPAALLAELQLAPATAQRGSESEPADRCESTDCFNQTRMRRVEVVDKTTLIVYVGQQDCPFLVELTGTFCDLTFLPAYDIVFRPSVLRQSRTPTIIGGPRGAAGRGAIEQPKVCASDIHLGLEQGPFTTAGGAPDEPTGLSCRIQDVRSLTDDQRLQVYVDREIVAPPPPFGTGRVMAPEQPQEVTADPDEAASAGDERDERRRRRRRRDRESDE